MRLGGEMSKYVYLKKPRMQIDENREYSKKVFLDQKVYLVDREIKNLGYLCFVGVYGNKTIIRYEDCKEVELEEESERRLDLIGSH